MHKVENWHFFGIGETNSPDWSWVVDTQLTYTPFGLAFRVNLKKGSYLRHVNITLPEKMKYNTQCCDDTTIQHFMWGKSPELKLENNKVSVLNGLHVGNQVTLNYKKLVCLRSHIWIQYLLCMFPHIYI